MIDTKTAYRLRRRGLRLNPDSDYENPRLKEIAIEMDVLIRCLEELDMELERLNENEPWYNITMSNYPNMSYAMYQNTRLALQQILDDLNEAQEKGITYKEYVDICNFSSSDEKYAMIRIEGLFEQIQDVLQEMRDADTNG